MRIHPTPIYLVGNTMITLLKYLIYEHAISVFFQNITKNLFLSATIIEFDNQFNHGTTYRQINFGIDGYLYQFMQVTVTRVSHTLITFEFNSAIICDVIDEDAVSTLWGVNESPITLELKFLIETI